MSTDETSDAPPAQGPTPAEGSDGETQRDSGAHDEAVLWVVATPIGCLEDITLRALRTLREAEVVLAEDTRHTAKLCRHHGIDTPLRSLHAHSSERRVEAIADELAGGARFALVSDAGTPLVSDPGAELVRACLQRGVRVVPIPGPSAPITALSASGLRADQLRFVGFLPRAGGKRKRALQEVASRPETTLLFESPRRLAATLEDLAQACGPARRACVCRELTKIHEEFARGELQELVLRFAEGTRGEVTLVVEGASPEKSEDTSTVVQAPREASPEERASFIDQQSATGLGAKAIARLVHERFGLERRAAYREVVARRDDQERSDG